MFQISYDLKLIMKHFKIFKFTQQIISIFHPKFFKSSCKCELKFELYVIRELRFY